jgi:hypothetical protein
MVRTTSRRKGAVTTFSQYLAGHLPFEHGLGQQILELGVLGFERLQALGVRDIETAELAAPQVIAGLRKPMTAAQILDGHPGIGLAQKTNDLLFGKTLLHVQSPCCG